MANIKCIELIKEKYHTLGEGHVLRLDWDNDRHQAIEFYGREPKDVIYGLKCTIHKLEQEYYNGALD